MKIESGEKNRLILDEGGERESKGTRGGGRREIRAKVVVGEASRLLRGHRSGRNVVRTDVPSSCGGVDGCEITAAGTLVDTP